ncbi:MGMT family protein [endosymbiont GvMRE of Glomus versiforme]|uniref:MGMT family protein n=1 Tax=endosymbiont GvMRE of Glomus versiforme TaxID=2039283 RepID=UPI000ED3E3C2|nr:MGMT family protein [endosymbiont GvMRE of Glomus versiforme]RHZ36261.1 Methylated-DNA-[protein]-cysteine S-methyltransferase [endosymbiont GvMRE of Glomus versiforme]
MPKLIIANLSQKVYNLCSQIPKGRVSTYKLIAIALSGSASYARTIGKILSKCECESKLNSLDSLCERVHCYRVINSNFSLGGFTPNGGKSNGKEIKRKKLASERVFFDKQDYLLRNLRKKVIFNDFHE